MDNKKEDSEDPEDPIYLLNPYQTMLVSKQGVRPSNEDTHTLTEIDGCYVYAVFDGHGGKGVSEFLSKNLAQPLVSIIKNITKVIEIKQAIQQLFLQIDTTLCKDCVKSKIVSGSTALVAVRFHDVLVMINLGDSRAVLFSDQSDIVFETEDHKPGTARELQRITECGGKVMSLYGIHRANGNLSVSRAIGDFFPLQFESKTKNRQTEDNKTEIYYTGVQSVISPIPDITILNLKNLPRHKDQSWYLLLACDGLWDVVSTQDAVSYVNQHNDKAVGAAKLVDFALTKSMDNITCIMTTL